jgi:D-alanyl-D-alanine endopeptidase (penicillin-binding protein 7)
MRKLMLLGVFLGLVTTGIGAQTGDVKPAAKAKAGVKTVAKAPAKSARAVTVKKVIWVKGKKKVVLQRVAYTPTPTRPSFGQLQGLHATSDPLELKSSVALVADQNSGEVLFSKNDQAVLPIASITKLMTAMVVLDGGQSLDEMLTVTDAEIDTEKGSRSRLKIGATLTRGEAMHLALMNSENRAAHLIARNYPGGLSAFVAAMNARAQLLGMSKTEYHDPTGLSSKNVSSAHDLTLLMKSAYGYSQIREWTTSPSYTLAVAGRSVQFNNTNRLVSNPDWSIGLQKTGYISEAGKCLVMQARIEGRNILMVFLDSAGKYTRLADAQRVRNWLQSRANAMRLLSPIGHEVNAE